MGANLPICHIVLSGLIMLACDQSSSSEDDQGSPEESKRLLIEIPQDPIKRSSHVVAVLKDIRMEMDIIPEPLHSSARAEGLSYDDSNQDRASYFIGKDKDIKHDLPSHKWSFGKEGKHDCSDASNLISRVMHSLEIESATHINTMLEEGSKNDNVDSIFSAVTSYIDFDYEILNWNEHLDDGARTDPPMISDGHKMNLNDLASSVESLASPSHPLKITGSLSEAWDSSHSEAQLTFLSGNSDNGVYASYESQKQFFRLVNLESSSAQYHVDFNLNSQFDSNLKTQTFSKTLGLYTKKHIKKAETEDKIEQEANYTLIAGKTAKGAFLELKKNSFLFISSSAEEVEDQNLGLIENFRLEKTSASSLKVHFESKRNQNPASSYSSIINIGEGDFCEMIVEKVF